MQLAGELSKISLPSLVQLVRNGGLTGQIALSQGAKTATIFVENGRIVHVDSDLGEGREAFLELFLWLTGTFSFIEGPAGEVPRSFSPDESIDRLVREGISYLEQKKYLDQLRINGQTILKPTVAARQTKSVPLLDRLDGRRTLAQALADANMSRRTYIQAVYRLLSDGLAVVVEPESLPGGDRVNLPGWVVARLKQDNPDLSQAIVDMVIWVDRVKCWMYQADADLERLIADFETAAATAGSGKQAAEGGRLAGEGPEESRRPARRDSLSAIIAGTSPAAKPPAAEDDAGAAPEPPAGATQESRAGAAQEPRSTAAPELHPAATSDPAGDRPKSGLRPSERFPRPAARAVAPREGQGEVGTRRRYANPAADSDTTGGATAEQEASPAAAKATGPTVTGASKAPAAARAAADDDESENQSSRAGQPEYRGDEEESSAGQSTPAPDSASAPDTAPTQGAGESRGDRAGRTDWPRPAVSKETAPDAYPASRPSAPPPSIEF